MTGVEERRDREYTEHAKGYDGAMMDDPAIKLSALQKSILLDVLARTRDQESRGYAGALIRVAWRAQNAGRDASATDRADVSRALRRLEKRGLVVREMVNGQTARVVLTQDGREIAEGLATFAERYERIKRGENISILTGEPVASPPVIAPSPLSSRRALRRYEKVFSEAIRQMTGLSFNFSFGALGRMINLSTRGRRR